MLLRRTVLLLMCCTITLVTRNSARLEKPAIKKALSERKLKSNDLLLDPAIFAHSPADWEIQLARSSPMGKRNLSV